MEARIPQQHALTDEHTEVGYDDLFFTQKKSDDNYRRLILLQGSTLEFGVHSASYDLGLGLGQCMEMFCAIFPDCGLNCRDEQKVEAWIQLFDELLVREPNS